MQLAFSYFFDSAIFWSGKEQFARALAFCEAASAYARTVTEKKEIYRLFAIIYDEWEKFPSAEYYFRKILALDCEDAGAWYGMAMVAEKTRHILQAESYYLHALHADPQYERAAFFLADWYDEQEQTEKALQWYHYALRCRRTEDTWRNLAALEEKRGNFDVAYRCLEMARQHQPDNPMYLLFLGMNRQLAGDYATAKKYYSKAEDMAPYLEEVYLNMSSLYLAQKRYAQCFFVLSKGLKRLPKAKKLRYNRACMLVKLGNPRLAIRELSRAVALDRTCAVWAQSDPDFDAVRERSDYQEVMKKGK